MSAEERDNQLKRLRHRSRQRGFAEADAIFTAFARAHLYGLSEAQLAAYGALLDLPDLDTFQWITGQAPPPDAFAEIVGLIQKSLRT